MGYHYDSNCIQAESLKDRATGAIASAWTALHKIFEQAGLTPNNYIMENVTFGEFMQALISKATVY